MHIVLVAAVVAAVLPGPGFDGRIIYIGDISELFLPIFYLFLKSCTFNFKL